MHKKNDIVISLLNVSKQYKLYTNKTDRMKEALSFRGRKYYKEFYALKDINLEVRKGEILGIIGRNGSGKSTLLKIISGIMQPSDGKIKTTGKIVPLLELGNGFNPEFTGMENIYFYNSILGFSRQQTDEKLSEILEFAEIGEFIHQPLKTYSSGMKARLAFAVSVNIDPDILIIDEVLAVGDELFRRKSYSKIEEFFNAGKTILFVSHSLNSILKLCTRAILLDNGSILIDGETKFSAMNYQKLLYSKEKERAKLIQEIKLNELSNKQDSNQKNKEKPKAKSYFIPNLQPKTTLDINNEDIHINEIHIENLDGEKVNCLVEGETYKYVYEVQFPDEFYDVSFGVRIKSEKGEHLGGVSLRQKNETIETVFPDKKYQVSYTFKCQLRPGIYYTNQGISSLKEGEIYYLRRIVDSSVFKVIEKEETGATGQFSFEQSIKVNEL